MSKGKIIIISGPSGSGKTTLHKRLLLSRRLKRKLVKSISLTTRPRRMGERSGRDYLFISPNEFVAKRKAGHFLEWQKVFDHYYGTPRKQVFDLLKRGISVLLCIDVKGARVVRHAYPKALSIFITTPSWNVLKNRLMKRGSETKKDLSLRLKTARKEMKDAKHYDYIVINDDLSKAFRRLEDIVLEALKNKISN